MPKKSVRKKRIYGGTNVNIEHMTELQFGLSELQAILQNPFKNLLEYDEDIKKLHDIYNKDIRKRLTARKRLQEAQSTVIKRLREEKKQKALIMGHDISTQYLVYSKYCSNINNE